MNEVGGLRADLIGPQARERRDDGLRRRLLRTGTWWAQFARKGQVTPVLCHSVDLAALVRTRRAEILRTCERNGATNPAIFGSVARGTAGPSSDIDLLVDLDPSRSLLDHIHLKHELEDLLGVRVDVVTRRGLHPLIRDAVMREAVPV